MRFLTAISPEHQPRRGDHRSVVALEKVIRAYLEMHNEPPKPLRRSKSADEIIASVNSAVRVIDRTDYQSNVKADEEPSHSSVF